MTDAIRIALNGRPTTIDGIPPTTTLLDWLRIYARMLGTKEGCAEGDCGACTVVLEQLTSDGGIRRSVINACITMIGQVDEWGVRTVEGLVAQDGSLHPVQSALAESGATQCGFCTPGIVMSAYAFAAGGEPADLCLVHDALAGNLCRCTGYRPIVDAIVRSIPLENDPVDNNAPELRTVLTSMSRDRSACFEFGKDRFYVPRSLPEALQLRAENPQALLLAGGTDLGLLASQKRKKMPAVIYLGKVRELHCAEERKDDLIFGAGVTYSEAFDLLTKHYPNLKGYWTRIGSRQIRNVGTLGGNIGTASPIGDALPILLALDAQVRVCSAARGSYEITAEEFFIEYRKTALASDELIEAIRIPKSAPAALLFADKVSKRRDQDISAVCGAYFLTIESGTVRDARIAFGGLAATPKRAHKAENALIGRKLGEATIAAAGDTLSEEFQPISDWRGGADYRLLLAKNLLRRLYFRIAEPSTLVECDAL
jgi:xanthine dehydrogenase small subunit